MTNGVSILLGGNIDELGGGQDTKYHSNGLLNLLYFFWHQ